jgi:plasmid stability protein
MAILNIRNLPDDVHARLRVRAAKAGRSMEAEARAILIAACEAEGSRRPPASLQSLVDELYGGRKPRGVAAGLLRERRKEAKRE